MSGVALPAREPGAKARLVLLSSNNGWIGLIQWLDSELESPQQPKRRMGIGASF